MEDVEDFWARGEMIKTLEPLVDNERWREFETELPDPARFVIEYVTHHGSSSMKEFFYNVNGRPLDIKNYNWKISNK